MELELEAGDKLRVYSTDDAPTLSAFLEDDSFIRYLQGPVGSGKSTCCNVELLIRAIGTPPGRDGVRRSRFAVIRNTYPELRDTTIQTFRAWMPAQLGTWRERGPNFVMDFECEAGRVVSEINFRALDRPGDIKKLLSYELTGCYINEAREIPRAILQALIHRVRRYPARDALPAGSKPWFGIWLDSNPPDVDHWLYKLFEEQRPPGHRIFKQPSGRGPRAENLTHLVDGYYAETVNANLDDPEYIKVYVDGEYGFPRTGKPIYVAYQDAVHCVDFEPDPRKLPIVGGQDFGLTPACVLAEVDPVTEQVRVFDELVADDMGAHRFAEQLVQKLKTEYRGRTFTGWGDPAGDQRAQTDERTPFEVMRGAGLPLTPAPSNDFTLRVETVTLLMRQLTTGGKPGLIIHPRCKMLRKACQGGYAYRRLQLAGADARFADAPDKNEFSHVAEALQYLLLGLGRDRAVVSTGEPRQVKVRFKVKRAYRGP